MTNSAYQIMAALTKDPELARATNLVDAENPQDLYTIILEKLLNHMKKGSDDPDENAKLKAIIENNLVTRSTINHDYAVWCYRLWYHTST